MRQECVYIEFKKVRKETFWGEDKFLGFWISFHFFKIFIGQSLHLIQVTLSASLSTFRRSFVHTS